MNKYNQNENIRNNINNYNNLANNNNNYNMVGGKSNIYVDNPSNRRLGRVGKGYGKKSPEKKCPKGKIRSPKGRCVKEIKQSKPTKPTKPSKPSKPTKPTKPTKPSKPSKPTKPTKLTKKGKTTKNWKLLFSPYILVFDKKWDLGSRIYSLDSFIIKKAKSNKDLENYIDFDKLVAWHKKQVMDLGEHLSTDKMKVIINNVRKEKKGIMAVNITTVYDSLPQVPYEVERLPEDDIEFIGQMIGSADDDGNYPITVKKSKKYKTNALVGSKLIGYSVDENTVRKKSPSDKVDSKNDRTYKITETKEHGKTRRLSAGAYYRKHGKGNKKVLGDVCQIRSNDKELKCLLERSNGTVYWAKKSKSGYGQKLCGSWRENCKE